MRHLLADVIAPLDALLLKGDADPTTRAIMTCALVLSAPPEPERLTRAFDRASAAIPRMRQRVVRSWTQGRPKWAEDERFDTSNHIRRVGAPGDGSLAAVISMASETAVAPLDPARPLWEATLVTGVTDGQAVLLLRVHHAIADGVRALQMMANLLDLEPEPAADVVGLEQHGARLQGVGAGLKRKASEAVKVQQRRAETLTGVMIDTTWRPIGAAADAATYVRSALRVFTDAPAAPSLLLSARSGSRVFETLEVPLDDLRTIARASSATINDVFLSVLVGGIRNYHECLGERVQDVPLAIPLDLAKDAAPSAGNHFSAAVMPGPCTTEDPRARLQLIHELVLSRRSEPGLDVPLRLAPLLHQAPSWMVEKGLKAYARRVDIQASNIIGPDFDVYLAGARVERFYAFGPLPGIPIMAVLVSYNGICTIGFTIDPAAVSDPALFLACTRESLGELARAHE